jgi:hypothetical protein
MRRTEADQGVRAIKFRSVLDRYEASEFDQMEAAELLGVSERTFRRWCLRYEDAGEAGLLDRRLGRTSGKRVPVDREEEVEALYCTRYSGFDAGSGGGGADRLSTFLCDELEPHFIRGLDVKSRNRLLSRRCWYHSHVKQLVDAGFLH